MLSPKNLTPPENVEKLLHLPNTYHLGPMRIVQYPARYHDIKSSAAGAIDKSGTRLSKTVMLTA